MKLRILILVLLLLSLQFSIWVGKDGLAGIWRLQREIVEQKTENERLHERNASLEGEVVDLKTGREALEERARAELGMTKKDETFYQVVGEPKR